MIIISILALVALVVAVRWIQKDMQATYSRARRNRIRTLIGV